MTRRMRRRMMITIYDDGNVDNDRRFMTDDATVPWVFSILVNSPKPEKGIFSGVQPAVLFYIE